MLLGYEVVEDTATFLARVQVRARGGGGDATRRCPSERPRSCPPPALRADARQEGRALRRGGQSARSLSTDAVSHASLCVLAGGGFRPGAWKSIDSLVRHQLVFRRNNQWQRSRNGFERGQMQCDEFSLTDKGVKFLKVMLEKFPEEDHDAGGAGGGRWSAPSSASRW